MKEYNNSLVSTLVSSYFPQGPDKKEEKKLARTKLLLSSCQDISQTETSEHLAKGDTAREPLIGLPLGALHFTIFFFNVYWLQ